MRIVRIDISDILAGETGTSHVLKLADIEHQWERLKLVGPLGGSLHLISTEAGVLARGQVVAPIELECHRCLEVYTHQAEAEVDGIFSRQPEVDEWPIDGRGQIDIGPMVEEAASLSLPIKQLCAADCAGIVPS